MWSADAYDRAEVSYGSAHVDPGAGWFPRYAGFADKTGRGDGTGFTRNVPVPPGSGDEGWLAPVVAVHEGGYHLPALARLTVATLAALAGR